MFMTLALILLVIGVSAFGGGLATKRLVEALRTGGIYYGHKESPDWRVVSLNEEPCRFWEGVVMHVALGVLCFGAVLFILVNFPDIIAKIS